MCEIYTDECSVCGKKIEMHLGDYLTTQSEIEVFCGEHIPSVDVVVWRGKDCWYSSTMNEYLMIGNPITVGIRSLTENARKNKDMNHLNLCVCDVVEER